MGQQWKEEVKQVQVTTIGALPLATAAARPFALCHVAPHIRKFFINWLSLKCPTKEAQLQVIILQQLM
jgi:hypothetical protein